MTHICISVPNTHHRLIIAAATCPRETSFSRPVAWDTRDGVRDDGEKSLGCTTGWTSAASQVDARTARRPFENFGRPKKIGDAQHARDRIYVEAERVPRQSARPPESHQREKRARPGARPAAAAATTTATAANTTGSTSPSLSRGHAVGTARTQRFAIVTHGGWSVPAASEPTIFSRPPKALVDTCECQIMPVRCESPANSIAI